MKSSRVHLAAVAGIAAAALVIAGCGSSGGGGGGGSNSGKTLTASAPGITAKQILIGSHQPLTGIAAPGYSEISQASNAYFQYVNAHGGVFGRKIVYKYLDDAYDPSKTTAVVHQLVLQDNVFAIFNGLGTPTHLAVAPFLNSEKVPDVFIASGCECWNATSTLPWSTGWQLDYVREGKILGHYIEQHFKSKKIGLFFQDDEFGQDGVKGLKFEIPAKQIVSSQSYNPANIKIAPQVAKLKAAGAQVVISFSVPAFTALLKLNMLGLKFSPQLVVSDVGSDPITLAGLLASVGNNHEGHSILPPVVAAGQSVSGDVTLDGLNADISAQTVSGDLETRHLEGKLHFTTVSGDLTVVAGSTSQVKAETVSGDMTLDLDVPPGARLDLSSVSGDVTLRLPESASLQVDAKTLSGSLDSAFSGVTRDGKPGRSTLRGNVGSGDGFLQAKTVSGDVTLLRRANP